MTWFEPTPSKTTSDPNEVLPPGIVQVYEGSSVTLNWSYSLSAGLGLGGVVRFKTDSVTLATKEETSRGVAMRVF